MRSSRTRSGASAWNRSSASRPSPAWIARNPSASRASASVSRSVGSSSTTRIVLGTPRSLRTTVNGELARSALAGQHPVLGERAALAFVVKFEQPVVVVDPRDLVVRRVGPVRARTDRDGLVALDRERAQVCAEGAGLVARAGVAAGVEPGVDDRVASDLRVVRGVPAVLRVGAEERRDVCFVVGLPGPGIGVEPLLHVLVGKL